MIVSADKLKLMVLSVGCAVHNADWNWKNVYSPFTRLFYISKGTADIAFADKVYHLKEDYMYLIPSFTKHSYICSGHFELYYLHIYDNNQEQNSCMLEDFDFPVEIQGLQLDKLLLGRLCNINPNLKLKDSNPVTYDNNSTLMDYIKKNNQRDLWQIVESRGIVLQLISRFVKDAKIRINVSDDRIQKSLQNIRRDIGENIKLESLSESVGLSLDHFIRLFKKEVGITPIQYINRKKIEKAQLLLITEQCSVKSIAFSVGFDDQSYFNRVFHKVTGLAPQEYRNIYIKN